MASYILKIRLNGSLSEQVRLTTGTQTCPQSRLQRLRLHEHQEKACHRQGNHIEQGYTKIHALIDLVYFKRRRRNPAFFFEWLYSGTHWLHRSDESRMLLRIWRMQCVRRWVTNRILRAHPLVAIQEWGPAMRVMHSSTPVSGIASAIRVLTMPFGRSTGLFNLCWGAVTTLMI